MFRKISTSIIFIVIMGLVFIPANFVLSAGAIQSVATESSVPVVSETQNSDPGIIGLFGLNWKLFIAQLINFGIIFYVLWRWVFKPVTANMQARASKIEESLANAKKIAQEKVEFEKWKQTEIVKTRTEAQEILHSAKEDSLLLKKNYLDATKLEQDKIIERTQILLEQEKADILKQASTQITDLVLAVSQTIIQDKLDPTKDRVFIDKTLQEAGNK